MIFRFIHRSVSKMAFGNKLGVKIEHNVDPRDFFAAAWGDIVCEVPADQVGNLAITYTVIGEVTGDGVFHYGNTEITMYEALEAWTKTLEDVFPTQSGVKQTQVTDQLYQAKEIYVCRHKVAKPHVFIPVFPGTNCEYDSTRAFERAGAEVSTRVFKNLKASKRRSLRHRSSCSRVAFLQVMSQRAPQNSSRPYSVMR